MGRICICRLRFLFLALVTIALAGCSKAATLQPATSSAGYTGILDIAYEGAPDVTTQLALGTLRLEDTGDAVSAEQAVSLLPLWKSLQGNVLQGDSERRAVVKQIEGTMSETQVSAIAAMRLTQEDVLTWARSQGAGFQAPTDRQGFSGGQGPGGREGQGGAPSGMTEDQIAQMRQQFQNMSPEELATRRAQFGAPGAGRNQGGPTGRFSRASGASSGGLTGAVITLLSERAGMSSEQVAARPRPERATPTPTPVVPAQTSVPPTPTPTTPAPEASSTATAAHAVTPVPEPTAAPSPTADASSGAESVVYFVRAGDSLAAIARAYGVTVAAIAEANGITDVDRIDVGQRLVIPNPGRAPTLDGSSGVAGGSRSTTGGVGVESGVSFAPLERLSDTAPGPPFTIEVSANRATEDPLVDKSQQYLVTGLVRNDGDRTYDVSTIDVTFYDASGFRGTFRKYPLVPGGEWLWHGETEAEFPCLLLAPGEVCPFLVEITAQDMASFLIHPNAVAVERQSAEVELSNLRLDDQGTRYLSISGTATNGHPFKVKNVTVAAVLLDANAEIVSLGSTYVVQDVEPGKSVSFELHIEKAPYVRYQLYAQAERY